MPCYILFIVFHWLDTSCSSRILFHFYSNTYCYSKNCQESSSSFCRCISSPLDCSILFLFFSQALKDFPMPCRSFCPALPYVDLQSKVTSVNSFRNTVNTSRYEPWFGLMPRVVPFSACWGITPSVLLWNQSKVPWKAGSSELEWFQVPSVQIRRGFWMLHLAQDQKVEWK